MNKKTYQTPSMEVIVLHMQAVMDAVSTNGVDASRNSYGNASKQDWGTSEE